MIPHNLPTLGEKEQQAAARVLNSGWVAQGHEVHAFENEVREYLGLGQGHAVALSSGTAALFLALRVLDARGKRVAIPVYSCAAVRNSVIMAAAEAVPIDSAPGSPNIDMQQAADGRADLIVAAHMFGSPSPVDHPNAPLPVIEDCAQAFGARLDGRPVGVSGAAGIFSFYATKMITSGGQGGMLVSADKSLVDAVRDFREFDCRRDRKPRFNLQMTDLQAGIGRAQLLQLGHFLAARKRIHALYKSVGLPLWPAQQRVGTESCCYRAILRVADPKQTIELLARDGIRAIVPLEEWELLADADCFPHAAELTHTTVSIPIHPSLPQIDIDHIIKTASAITNAVKLEIP
jgi:perosamine synthetase